MNRPGAPLAALLLLAVTVSAVALLSGQPDASVKRVEDVRAIPGLVAFWDFVLREEHGERRFLAHAPKGRPPGFPLDAVNYVRPYWDEGRPATYGDVPLLGRGPFGEAVQVRAEEDSNFRPTLLVPRETLHDTGLDVKGPGASVSMAVWMIRQGGNHAIAGIWHEGTDLGDRSKPAATVQAGRRQYALFAGLAANTGASAVHLSENGGSSFGDRYARNLATTERLIPTATPGASDAQLDAAWSVVGFVFDNQRNIVTAYLDGQAGDYWVDNPESHPFFQWPARGWKQAQLKRMAGAQEGEDPNFPASQLYEPPERNAQRERLPSSSDSRVWEEAYAFTKVRVTERRNPRGRWEAVAKDLTALRVNPFWFGHDLYNPRTPDSGGPFTIGRVIHSSRGNGTQQFIGGVAVFNRAVTAAQMRRLARIGRTGADGSGPVALLRAGDLPKPQEGR